MTCGRGGGCRTRDLHTLQQTDAPKKCRTRGGALARRCITVLTLCGVLSGQHLCRAFVVRPCRRQGVVQHSSNALRAWKSPYCSHSPYSGALGHGMASSERLPRHTLAAQRPGSTSVARRQSTVTPRRSAAMPQEPPTTATKTATIVLMAGFEAFNLALYKKAAARLSDICSNLRLVVFTDRDVASRPDEVAVELDNADVFFGSLIFDYDQVTWLQPRLEKIPTRFIFESALELMSLTKVGSFSMAKKEGEEAGRSGPPPVVKALLSKFGSKREEDRLKGYLSFLKVGPSILRFVPGKKAQDVRTWLEVYSYWNQGGMDNVVSLFLLLAQRFNLVGAPITEPLKLVETPSQGLIHPLAPGVFFDSPRQYLQWYMEKAQDPANAMAPPDAPRVAVLLYRKHVITNQLYISQLLRTFEKEGLLPVPVFINGVEGHTIVRDLLTTRYEQEQRANGIRIVDSLSKEAVEVDAVLNTIGFPLVGGPAGSMEAGRRVDVATRLLSAKNVPYFVSSPLLIQDIKSWRNSGVLGLQSAVLYSLPELDGAVDTVVLGGLVGDKIALIPERVRKLLQRIKGWHRLRTLQKSERKVAVLLYGFPPNVGAIGTAALLNVPRSLENLLKGLQDAGYDTGIDARQINGEAIVAVLTAISQEAVIRGGPERMNQMVDQTSFREGVEDGRAGITAKTVTADEFRAAVGRRTADRVEKMWGDLHTYVGLCTSQKGELIVGGLQLGNVWVGVQPLLGIEGDPMRLLFERDLTPHPQYVAFYDWMRKEFGAHAVVHFGMHGTAEWLPGSPLGNTAETWPDILMGDIPNMYVYAANNPSESILAKRRGYGTIISHNVPPYSRAGLYKDLAQLRELISEYRESPEANAGLRPVIAGVLDRTGLYEDCPFSATKKRLTADDAEKVSMEKFDAYMSELVSYLGVLEQRLFSEGLHVLGEKPTPQQIAQYLDAYFDKSVPAPIIDAIAHLDTASPATDPRVLMSRLVDMLRQQGVTEEDLGPDIIVGQAPYHWYNSLSNEDKYGLEVLGLDLVRFYTLKIRRAFGDQAAKMELEQLVNAAMGARQDEGIKMEEVRQRRDTLRSKLLDALEIKRLLEQNTQELTSLVGALNGEYVLPGVGGDLLRDGTGVLPTGRNIHALDPYRMPSPGAWERGQEAAKKIISQHLEREGAYPETVAVMLWGLDAIKTRGESVAIVLALVGARPVKEATGRVVKYELIPLSELGRPRVDVLASLSGIFRDSFANVVDLLDDLFERVANADEDPEFNYVRKHALKLKSQGVERPSARLFSNPAGDYGSLVNERVGNGDWEKEDELGQTWESRNVFSFGRGEEKGVKRGEVLKELLATTNRIVQEIDSVEYGLTDIQEYYANTGALKKAAEVTAAERGQKGKKVGVSIVESFSRDVDPQDLETTLRMEYRSKLLNPKWAKAMVAQGSGGAYEISQRMTAMVGWSSTSDFKEQWMYDGAAEMYALDEEMAQKLTNLNPEAFRNVVKRMLEANGRGYWDASEETLEKLRDLYTQAEDDLELNGGLKPSTTVLRNATPREQAAVAQPSSSATSSPAAATAAAATGVSSPPQPKSAAASPSKRPVGAR